MIKLTQQDKQLLINSLRYGLNYFNKVWHESKAEAISDIEDDTFFEFNAHVDSELVTGVLLITGDIDKMKMDVLIIDAETDNTMDSLRFSIEERSLYSIRSTVDKFKDEMLVHFKCKSNLVPSKFWGDNKATDFFKGNN